MQQVPSADSANGIISALRVACTNAKIDATITELPRGEYALESVDADLCGSTMTRALSSICWRMNCDIVLSRSAGVVITPGGTYERAERPLPRQVRARAQRISKGLPCGAALRARAAAVMHEVCQFRYTHFMPNFTIECPRGGLQIVCHVTKVHVQDLAAALELVTDIHYSSGYLTLTIAPEDTRKRTRGTQDTEDERPSTLRRLKGA